MREVYFLRREDGLIKIGCSVYPDARRKQISSDLKQSIELIASVPGEFQDEARLHREFAEYRVEGEWFKPSPRVFAAIGEAVVTKALPTVSECDRAVEFERRYLGGETLQEIADDHGITRERVRQILRANGVPSLGWRGHYARLRALQQSRAA